MQKQAKRSDYVRGEKNSKNNDSWIQFVFV